MIKNSCCVIIPCYKTDFVILETYLSDIIKYWNSEDVLEIILVIDGGLNEEQSDVQKFIGLKEKFNNLRLILNHKHLGQQKSVLNGFDLSNSNILITLDDDYKYPVENLSAIYEKFKINNNDCLIAKPEFEKRSFLRNIGTSLVKKIFSSIYNKKEIYFTSYRLIKKNFAKNILKKNYPEPVIGYLILEETNKVKNFLYKTNKINAVSRYKFIDLFKLFVKMNFFYTNVFYKLFFYLGSLFSIITLFLIINYLYNYFFSVTLPGFTTIVILILVLIQFFFLSVAILLKYITSVLKMLKEISFNKEKQYQEL